jgi:hypothetical protein
MRRTISEPVAALLLTLLLSWPALSTASEFSQEDAIKLFEAALPQLRAVHADQYDTPSKLQAAWKRFEETLALAETARKKGLETTAQIRYRIDQMLSEELILREAEMARPVHSITDAEVRDYFEAHNDRYDIPAMLGAQEILLKLDPSKPSQHQEELDRAATLAKALGTGIVDTVTFAAFSRTNSDPEFFRQTGGNLGIFPVRPYNDRQPPLPAQAINALLKLNTVGQVAGPIRTTNEIRILRLSARRERVAPNLQAFKESIRYALYFAARQKRIQQLAAESGMNLDSKLSDEQIKQLLPSEKANAQQSPNLPPIPAAVGTPAPEPPVRPNDSQSP